VIHNRPELELLKELATSYKLVNDDSDESLSSLNGYDYLLKMPLRSLTLEKVESLTRELEQKEKELEKLRSTTAKEMWMLDLNNLEVFNIICIFMA
jgi:hypothetical protein